MTSLFRTLFSAARSRSRPWGSLWVLVSACESLSPDEPAPLQRRVGFLLDAGSAPRGNGLLELLERRRRRRGHPAQLRPHPPRELHRGAGRGRPLREGRCGAADLAEQPGHRQPAGRVEDRRPLLRETSHRLPPCAAPADQVPLPPDRAARRRLQRHRGRRTRRSTALSVPLRQGRGSRSSGSASSSRGSTREMPPPRRPRSARRSRRPRAPRSSGCSTRCRTSRRSTSSSTERPC